MGMLTFPSMPRSRLVVDINNTLDAFIPGTQLLNGSLRFYQSGPPADYEERSRLYGNAILLNGESQMLISDEMVFQCLTHPGDNIVVTFLPILSIILKQK